MSTTSFTSPPKGTPARGGNRVAVWALLIAALVLLTLAAGLRADARELTAHATRTQNFVASGNLKSLAVENVNGSVEILSGPSFKADVDVTTYASTEAIAKKRLEDVKVRFDNENGELSLYTEEPGVTVRRSGRGWHVHSDDDDHTWRTEVKYRVTIPPGLSLSVSTVNGAVSVLDLAAPMDLSTVNGKIDVTGARREAKLNTVNGAIRAAFAELQKGVDVDVRTVNGGIALTLPAKAGFRFEGHTMSGEILSSFALPAAADDDQASRARDESKAARDKIRGERDKIKAEIKEKKHKTRKSDEDDDGVIDLSELNEALQDLNREMAEMSRELSRTITVHLNRAYEGTVGDGGAHVRCSNLNGRIVLLAEGTTEAQAKRLTSSRGPIVVTVPAPRAPRAAIPPVPPVPPVSPVPPVPPIPPVAADPWGRSISKGDLPGDLVLSYAPGDVTAGHVGGHVKISTQSGQIRVKGAGKGAELSSAGGDIRIESVTGELKATTSGGDIRAGAVSGDARLETAGGDVVIHSAGGSVTARTGGGDITLKKVHGPVVARTSGGTVLCEISSAAAPGGELMTNGGDVIVTLPSNYRADIDVRVSGGEMDADAIASQFPEIVVTRRPGSVTGEGKLNGGGPKLIIRSTSGSVSVRKGPAA
ncbi:MAG: DUF4097 family beta strand repeat-containing protein [Thermoanaerobaculia bacterium]